MPIANTKDNLSLCEYLVERRKFMKLRAVDLSSRTGIPHKYVKKIEAGEWLGLPSGVYARGFLKKYAKAVGLDENEVANRYDFEVARLRVFHEDATGLDESKQAKKGKFFRIDFLRRASVRTIFFVAVAVFIVIYVGWQFSIVLEKPGLSVSYPSEDISVSESKLFVEGKVSPGNALTINNEPVYAESGGSFKKEMELLSGMNVLEIKAVSRFGKESKIIRRVTYNQ